MCMQRSRNENDQFLVAEELSSYYSTLANFVTKVCISLRILEQPLLTLASLDLITTHAIVTTIRIFFYIDLNKNRSLLGMNFIQGG